ncbi:MAG: CARDB domain-containing protein, partial [Patescibacteria group bacterium]
MVGTIAESNESDNCGAWTPVTVSATAAPDLTVSTVTPTTATAGAAVTLSSTVSNVGTASTGTGFTNLFQVASDASGTGAAVIGTAAQGVLAAGASGNTTISDTFSAGVWYVRVCADTVTAVAESNEINNCGAWTAVTVSATAAPNLTAGAVTPTVATLGTAVTLSSTITNSGTASTQSTFTDLFQMANDASGTGATSIGTDINVGKTAGASGPSTLSYTFTSGGTKYVRVCADTTNAVAESNEADNCGAWTAVTVTVASGPVAASCIASPSSVELGELVTWTATASGGNGAYTYVWGGADNLTGSSATVYRAYTTAGTKNAAVQVTSAGIRVTVLCSNTVTVTAAAPNLTADIEAPVSTTPNTAITLTSTVSNIGTATTGGAFWTLFQTATSASGAGATDIGSNALASIAGGSSRTTTRSHTFTSAGIFYVRACADKSSAANAGLIAESNESD